MEPLQPLNPLSSSRRPRSISSAGPPANSRSGGENAPPMTHPNVHITRQSSASALKKPYKGATEPPRSDAPGDGSLYPSDSSIKVVVRVRPSSTRVGAGVQIITDVSSDSLSIGNRKFTFDSVLGPESSQEDVFKVVGVPLVQNALAGYNASIISHGLTGSGKTYTMWGPQSAMLDAISADSCQGIVPRIFQMLFSEIHRKQECLDGKHFNYQCRCSFLEIYNERINDLLDPTQRNLQIRDDAKNGFYVENLTDEFVNTVEDVTQILVKGLSNRKVGATTINSKSSRSHIIFNCIVESWCKGTQSAYFSNSKISRISLVDLAGLDSHRSDGVRKCLDDGRQVKQSLRKLGRLVKALSEAAHSGENQKIVYTGSCLTHLLKESLGGNAKVTYICAISPEDRAGTLGTLRFGDRVKCIQNKAVINEITEDAVNGLTDQIRRLKEELVSTTSKGGNSAIATGGYFKGHIARDSLNQLRVSLNRSLILPAIDADSEEEADVDENDVNELCVQLQRIHSDFPVQNLEDTKSTATAEESLVIKNGDGTDSSVPDMCDQLNDGLFPEESKFEQVHLRKTKSEVPSSDSCTPIDSHVLSNAVPSIIKDHQPCDSSSKSLLLITPRRQIPPLHEPTISESPKFGRNIKKCLINSSGISSGQNIVAEREECNLAEKPRRTFGHFAATSLQSCKVRPTESLAASLQRGLQIIDYHQRNSASRKPVLGLSLEHFASTQHPTVGRVDAAVQTSDDDGSTSTVLTASACEMLDTYRRCQLEPDNPNTQIIQVNNAGMRTARVAQKQVVQDEDMILAAFIKREKELQAICAEQAAEIKQLNHLVHECKVKHEHWSIINQDKEIKLPRLEGLTDGSDCNGKGNVSSSNHYSMLSTRNDKDHHEVPKGDHHGLEEGSRSFDFSEKEALLLEIQSLKNQLNSCTSAFSREDDDFHLKQIREGVDYPRPDGRGDKLELDRERQRWIESESQWICLTEELRIDLESNRRLAEKKELELSMEKKCSAELDDALHRAIVGHARIVEHYVELQEKHDCLLERHRRVMEGIAEVKKAAKKAGAKGSGSAFTQALAAELSTLRIERERERAYLKAENKGLKIQLRDTAEAVHAAGELLVRLREAEEAALVTEEKYESARKENEKLTRQMEKQKRKHAMEMTTMKHYLAESRLPESALEPLYRQESERMETRPPAPDDHSWQAAFRPAYD